MDKDRDKDKDNQKKKRIKRVQGKERREKKHCEANASLKNVW